ncbi:hypothetical protein Tco_1110513 [Tanacetum coccineum]|uniref:Uncharacterized protein n=1 Tax=Tanacetum coccineum TaxID=301880 RepID=A0ABQ5IKF9_9ASTR
MQTVGIRKILRSTHDRCVTNHRYATVGQVRKYREKNDEMGKFVLEGYDNPNIDQGPQFKGQILEILLWEDRDEESPIETHGQNRKYYQSRGVVHGPALLRRRLRCFAHLNKKGARGKELKGKIHKTEKKSIGRSKEGIANLLRIKLKPPARNGLVDRENRSLGRRINARLDEKSKDLRLEELPHSPRQSFKPGAHGLRSNEASQAWDEGKLGNQVGKDRTKLRVALENELTNSEGLQRK